MAQVQVQAIPMEMVREAARLKLASAHPAGMGLYLHHRERSAPIPAHLEHISRRIAAGIRRGGLRLLVRCPVRHGKSYLVSHDTPVWCLARYPNWNIVIATYGSTFAEQWSRKVRDDIKTEGYRFGVQVRPDVGTAARWLTTAGGGVVAAGVGSALTGFGAKCLIIDDPIKDAAEAHSQVYRDNLWEWWQSVARTRLEPGASVIMALAPWHYDSIDGRILDRAKRAGEQWETVTLPALAGPDDPLHRAPGAPLWPERYDRAALEETRATVDAWTWSSLYQCTPSPESGAVWNAKQFRYYQTTPGFYHFGSATVPYAGRRFLIADLALSTKESADYTVIGTWEIVPVQGVPQLVLVDLWRARAQAPAVKAKMWELYRLHKPEFFGIEKAHYGMAYCQELRTEGMMVRELMPDKDKLSRARAASVAFENNRVWFPERAGQMLLDLEHELLTFPDGAHDDQVDVVSYACGILRDGIASQGYGYDVRHGGGVQDPFDDH